MFKLTNFIGRFAGLGIEQLNNKKEVVFKITGFNTRWLIHDIAHMYGTSRVGYMFKRTTGYYVEIHTFYLLDFDKALTDLQNPANKRGSAWIAKRIQDLIRSQTWLRNLFTPQEDIPKKLNLKHLNKFVYTPLDYQKQLLIEYDVKKWRLFINGIILDAVMGSGKTMMYLYIAECSEAEHIVVVTPQNAIDRVWNDTIKNKLKYTPTVWRSDSGLPYRGEKYIIIHYEALGQAMGLIKFLHNKKVTVGVDECHNFNDLKSQRTQHLIAFCRALENKDVIFQSGTVFKAMGAEIIAAIYCIDPNFSESLEDSFKRLFSASARDALQLLQNRLDIMTYRVTSEQVGLGSPITHMLAVKTPDAGSFTLSKVLEAMRKFTQERQAYYKTRQDRDHETYKKCVAIYRSQISSRSELAEFSEYERCVTIIRRGDLMNAKDEVVWANQFEKREIEPSLPRDMVTTWREVKTIYKYINLKIQGECLGKVVGGMRKEAAISIAKYIDPAKYIESTTKKTLFYTNYVEVLTTMVERCKEEQYIPAYVYAETNKDINKIIQEFETKPEINPLVATFHSLSTAIPMTMADTMVMIDSPFRDHIYQQTVARIHRLGKDSQTTVFVLRLDTGDEPNISTRTVDILRWSQGQIELITGVKSPFEIEDKKVSIEAMALASKEMELVEDDLETAFMSKLV